MDFLGLELHDIILLFLIIFVAAFMQSTVGFGFALIASPLMLIIGLPLHSIIALTCTCSFMQAVMGTWKLREEVPWKLTFLSSFIRLSFLTIGIFLLKELIALPDSSIKLFVGSIICIIVIIQFLWRPKKHSTLHWSWSLISFTISGLMAGTVGMGGPPLIMWSLAQNWNSLKVRAFLFSAFSTSIPFQLVILYFTFGNLIIESIVLSCALIPVIALATFIALPIGNKIDKEKLKYIAYSLILILGLTSVIPQLPGFFQ